MTKENTTWERRIENKVEDILTELAPGVSGAVVETAAEMLYPIIHSLLADQREADAKLVEGMLSKTDGDTLVKAKLLFGEKEVEGTVGGYNLALTNAARAIRGGEISN